MSSFPDLPEITVSVTDFNRLSELLDHSLPVSIDAEGLSDELNRATIVDHEKLPQNVVCMNSRIRFLNENDGKVYERALVYPHEVAQNPENISILAPAGTALLGLHTGSSIEWAIAGRRKMRIRLLEVFQPEEKTGANDSSSRAAS